MTIIFCDASRDNDLGISAWGCVVIRKNKETVYTGHYKDINIQNAELRAVVKALGKVKGISDRTIVFTDFLPIVIASINYKCPPKNSPCIHDSTWPALCEYLRKNKGRLSISYTPRNQNPAHRLAKDELKRLRKVLIDQVPQKT